MSKEKKLWNICQTCNLYGKELYKKFQILASNLIGLNDQDIRIYVLALAEFYMSKDFKFDCTKKIEKEIVSTGLDKRTITHLLDLRDRE